MRQREQWVFVVRQVDMPILGDAYQWRRIGPGIDDIGMVFVNVDAFWARR